MGELQYARTSAGHLAYRVLGDAQPGGHDVVLAAGGGTMPMDALFEDPVALRFVEGLADLGRLVLFDRSGIGLSDSPPTFDDSLLSRWCEDLEAVIVATGLVRPVLVTQGLGAGVSILHGDRHPTEVSSLVLLSAAIRPIDDDIARRQIDGEVDSVALWFPSRADDPSFRDWFVRAGQRGASPGRAVRAYLGTAAEEIQMIEQAASRLQIPTLVLRRPAHPITPSRQHDPLLALIPGAVRVDLPGEDLFAWGGEVDALLSEITGFVTGDHRPPVPERILAAVLFSDIVASTDRASSVGDARWNRLLDRHDDIARSCIGRRGGTFVSSTSDGVVAVFPSATSAFRSAKELRAALREEDLHIRVGIHVGDIDRRGADISGINVVIAARIAALAGAGEILLSNIALAATGGSAHVESRGEHRLKGVRGTWPIYSIVDP